MRVLVTGGLGYVGWVVTRELLRAGHDVDVTTRGRTDAEPAMGARLIEVDIRDRARLTEIVHQGGYDGVCHLAALTPARDSVADPLTYYDVNVGGTLIDVARHVSGRAITVEHLPAKTEPHTLIADSTSIRRELGWILQHSSLNEILWSAAQASNPERHGN